MFLLPRHKEILEIARKQGKVLVEELASRFEITPQTIRKHPLRRRLPFRHGKHAIRAAAPDRRA
jgi:hypothetical protein